MIRTLNGLRAIAAMTVLVGHCFIWSAYDYSRWPPALAPGTLAKFAVDLFMMLSGFLMAMNTADRWPSEPMTQGRSWLSFYSRRFFRIAPAYYVSLVLVIAISAPFVSGYQLLAQRSDVLRDSVYNAENIIYSWKNILLHISFIFGFLPSFIDSTLLPDWSLSLEMQFYFFFPALYLVVRRFGLIWPAAAIGLVALVSGKLLGSSFVEPSFLPFKLPVFFAGILVYERTKSDDRKKRLILLTIALAMSLSQWSWYGRYCVLIAAPVGLMAILTGEVAGNRLVDTFRGIATAILANRIADFLSDLSYSAYLFHGIFISIIGSALVQTLGFQALNSSVRVLTFIVAVMLPTLILSAAIHRAIERPGILLGRSVDRAISRRTKVATQ